MSRTLKSRASALTTFLAMIAAVPAIALQMPATAVGLDVTALDRKVGACDDFYQFACGGWLATHPIPSDESSWGRFNELAERNRTTLRTILEKAAAEEPSRPPLERQIGDHYAACMDEAGIEAKGARPLQPELDRIAALTRGEDLPGLVAHLHELGAGPLFQFGSQQDFKDASSVIAIVDQGGMGLPDRDYYLAAAKDKVEIRGKYEAHVRGMLELLGDPPARAARGARQVLQIETALARASLDPASRRQPEKVYHKMTRAGLLALAPRFSWTAFLEATGAPPVQALNVAVPPFARAVSDVVARTDLDALKTYLRWHLVNTAASQLPAAFVNEDFAFEKVLTGAKELRPRWKRCVDFTDADLGEALGRRYVEVTFGEEGQRKMAGMVAALEEALRRDVEELPWMTPATRQQAVGKLKVIANKIGHPERWRDYGALVVRRDDALGNSLRANAFESKRQLAKIGRPVDRAEWQMSPPTVNAYYDPSMNDINFPAGILQPPFFDRAGDEAVNFGAIGAVIGHELTHGFDDQGRKFDAQGNLRDWWTAEDAREFERRAACFVEQYGGYSPVKDVKLNGRLTLGENTADNGGVRIAHMALMQTKESGAGREVAGFTPEQRFFLGWAQIWCEARTEEFDRMLAQIDPHSPPRFRVNGVVSGMPEFQRAFACSAGAPMARADACRVW